MREEIESLKHETDTASLTGRVPFPKFAPSLVYPDPQSAESDDTLAGRFKMVYTTQKRRLAGSGRTDQNYGFALLDIETDRVENQFVAKTLAQISNL